MPLAHSYFPFHSTIPVCQLQAESLQRGQDCKKMNTKGRKIYRMGHAPYALLFKGKQVQ